MTFETVTAMTLSPIEIASEDVTDPAAFLREVAEPCRPVVMRGMVNSWPAVSRAYARRLT